MLISVREYKHKYRNIQLTQNFNLELSVLIAYLDINHQSNFKQIMLQNNNKLFQKSGKLVCNIKFSI